MVKVNLIGAAVITLNLLKRSKAGKEGPESVSAKVNKPGFANRVSVVQYALNTSGTSAEAAQRIIAEQYFTDVELETLGGWIEVALAEVAGANKTAPALMLTADEMVMPPEVAAGEPAEDE